MKDHPLKVYFPLAGKFYIFRHSSHNLGTEVVLSKNIRSIYDTAKKLFKDDSTTKIIDYHLVEMVAPSDKMISLAIEKEYQDNIFDFVNETSCMLIKLHQAGLDIPKPLALCKKYNSPYTDIDPKDQEPGEHTFCDNCVAGIQLEDLTPEQFYLKFHKAWNVEYPRSDSSADAFHNKRMSYSRAEQAGDEESIWTAENDRGVNFLDELTSKNGIGRILFYFRRLDVLDTSILQEMINKENIAYKISIEKKDAIRKQEMIVKDQEDIQKILKVFNYE